MTDSTTKATLEEQSDRLLSSLYFTKYSYNIVSEFEVAIQL